MKVREGVGPVIRCQCGCGAKLTAYDERKRPREYLRGHNVRAALVKK